MENLNAGAVWKSKQLLGYAVEITKVSDAMITYREIHPNGAVKSVITDDFTKDFEFYMTEYRLPYDVGTEYI